MDFFGGQQPSTGGRTFPLLRIRRAFAELTRGRLNVFVGQESPPIAEINPSSLASIGIPEFAGAGNLWLWIPQVRVGATRRVQPARSGSVWRLPCWRPPPGDAQTAFFTQPDIAERTSRPYLQGRVRARWGDGDDSGRAEPRRALWLARDGRRSRVVPRTGGERLDTDRPRARAPGRGVYREALAGLGGGGIGQNFGLDSAVVSTTGGWIQLNVRPGGGWEIGGGAGMDDPDDADLDPATQRLRNLAVEGHASWRRAPAVLGAEVRWLQTRYGAGGRERHPGQSGDGIRVLAGGLGQTPSVAGSTNRRGGLLEAGGRLLGGLEAGRRRFVHVRGQLVGRHPRLHPLHDHLRHAGRKPELPQVVVGRGVAPASRP